MKKLVAFVVILGLVGVAQAGYIADFESGFSDGVTLDGTAGWFNTNNDGTGNSDPGLIAEDDKGVGGGWAAYQPGPSSWIGSAVAHGMDQSEGNVLVLDTDIYLGSDDTRAHMHFAEAVPIGYPHGKLILALGENGADIMFGGYDNVSGAAVFSKYAPMSLDLNPGWHHGRITWDIGTSVQGEVWLGSGTSGTKVFDVTEAFTAKPDFPNIMFNKKMGIAAYDNITVTVTMTTTPVPVVPSVDALVEDTFATEFVSKAGITYELESTPDLVSSNYSGTGAFVIGTGTNMFLFDPTGYSDTKYYRVAIK